MSNDRFERQLDPGQPSAVDHEDEPIDVTPPPVWAASPDGPDDEEGPRPPLSKRRRIALSSVAAVGVLGLAAVGIWGGRIISQQDTTMSTPATVAGLQLNSSADAAATADDLKAAFAAGIDLNETVGAVYTDPAAAERSVLFFGGTALLWSPEKDLDTLFGLVGDESGAVDGVREVPAGELGGVMKCGTTAVEGGGTMAVCGWADHGATGMALFPSRSAEEAAGLMRQIRTAVQIRD